MNNGWTGGQYSIFRVILGVSVCAWSVATILPLQNAAAESSSEWWILTSLLAIVPILSVLLAIGWHDQLAAVLVAILTMFFLKDYPGSATGPVFPLAFLLILHASLPAAPYGSLAARGRLDPGNSWEFRSAIYSMGWLWLAGLHIFPPINQGEAIPIDSIVLVSLAIVPRVRPWCWAGLFLVFCRTALHRRLEEELSIILLQLFTFDPRWIPPLAIPSPLGGEGSNAEHIFYDGHCGLCHRAVRFVLAEDRAGNTFRFAPLDSDAFRAAIPEEERKNLPDSIVVRTADGRTLIQAQAVLYIMQRLGGLWRIIATLVQVVPPGLLNIAYAGVARVRRRIFAAPAEACPILPKHLRGRFDF